MKKMFVTLMLITTALVAAACSSDNKSEQQSVTIGTIVGPYTEMMETIIQPELEKKGYQVNVKRYDDYVSPNKALEAGELDANLVQDAVALANFNDEFDASLTSVLTVPTAPLGLYSEHYTSIDQIENNALITIPKDDVGTARALQLLASLGVIELDPSVDPITVTEQNIVKNEKQIVIQPVEPRHLVLSMDSADAAIIPGSFAIRAELELMDAIVLEELHESFRLTIAVASNDEQAQLTKDIEEVVQSEAFKSAMEEQFVGFSMPNWMH